MNRMHYKQSSWVNITFVLAIFAVSSCFSFSAQKYNPKPENTKIIKGLRYNAVQISVGEFTAEKPGKNSIKCRGVQSVGIKGGTSFEKFIQESLIAELKAAGIYADSAKTVLTGRLDGIDFNSGTKANWNISMTMSAPGHDPFLVKAVHKFREPMLNPCNGVSREFVPAVQNFVGTLFDDPKFQNIVTSN